MNGSGTFRSINLFDEIFTPAEIAAALKVSVKTVRRLFQDCEGVIKLGAPNPRGQRGYETLRIPRPVAERVLRERGYRTMPNPRTTR
jgi:hypothetical protein